MVSAVINTNDFVITSARDATVTGFDAENNKKLEKFPKNLAEKFPNLILLDGHNCSIKQISKESFRGLNKLKILDLGNNQIERIDDDTFAFIPAVGKIWLGE